MSDYNAYGGSHNNHGRRSKPQHSSHELSPTSNSRPHQLLIDDHRNVHQLFPGKYTEKDIALNISNECKYPITDKLIGVLLTCLLSPIANTYNHHDMLHTLNMWMEIFDKVFFFDAVRRITGFPVCADERFTNGEYGFYHDTERIIYIDLDMPIEPGYQGSREEWYVCVLLHEMVHAFISIYSCQCRDCRVKNLDPRFGGSDREGHGGSWANSIFAIETVMKDAVLWPVDCRLAGSVKCAMEGNDWRPRDDQLIRWGVVKGAGTMPGPPQKLLGYDEDRDEDPEGSVSDGPAQLDTPEAKPSRAKKAFGFVKDHREMIPRPKEDGEGGYKIAGVPLKIPEEMEDFTDQCTTESCSGFCGSCCGQAVLGCCTIM